jgi:hypothetical protein
VYLPMSDVALAFTARFLIRMANLCPHMLDLRQVGKDVELVANKLNQGGLSLRERRLSIYPLSPRFSLWPPAAQCARQCSPSPCHSPPVDGAVPQATLLGSGIG